MHLVDAFIWSNLVHLGSTFYQYVFSVSMKPMTLVLLAPCSTSYIYTYSMLYMLVYGKDENSMLVQMSLNLMFM